MNVVILTAKDRGKGGFGLYDKDLVADVDNLDFKVVDDEQLIVYNANLFGLNRKLVSDTLIFYGRLKLLAQRIKDHQRLTKTSMQKIPPLAAEKVGAPTAFAAILRAPSAEEAGKGGLPQVELVQLGTPLCGDGKEMPQNGCPEGRPASFQVRNDTTAGWQAKGLAGSATEAADKLIFVRPNRIWDAIFEGSQRFADEVQYFQRLSEIETLTTDLIKDRKDIEDRLGAAAARGKAFAL